MLRLAAAAAAVLALAALASGTAGARVADDRQTDGALVAGYVSKALGDLRLGLGDLTAFKHATTAAAKRTDIAKANQEIKLADDALATIRPVILRRLGGDPNWMGGDPLWSTLKNADKPVAPVPASDVSKGVGIDWNRILANVKALTGASTAANTIKHPPCTVTTTFTPGTASSEPSVHFYFQCDENVTTMYVDTEQATVEKCAAPANQCQVSAGHEVTVETHGADGIFDLVGAALAAGDPDIVEIKGDSGDPTFIDDIF